MECKYCGLEVKKDELGFNDIDCHGGCRLRDMFENITKEIEHYTSKLGEHKQKGEE